MADAVFLIISDNDSNNETYARDLANAYHDAIEEFNSEHKETGDRAGIVGSFKLDQVFTGKLVKKVKADCLLYAGELEGAHGLMHTFRDPKPLIILSDSSLESRLSDNALSDFKPVRFTYQTDASDYNNHTNVYGKDAYFIAKQLIGDLNKRGGDFRYELKSLLHLHSAKDARRSLVQILQENSLARTWYQGAPDPQGEPGITYLFSQHKRIDAIFHVWQLSELGSGPSSPMDDIDNWHPPKTLSAVHKKSAPLSQFTTKANR